MHPAIPQGSFVFVNRLAYALRQPKIGEVVVMRHPRKSNADIIVSSAAARGEPRHGREYRAASRADECGIRNNILSDPDRRSGESKDFPSSDTAPLAVRLFIKRVRDVQDNLLFVVGDNEAHSTDSRFFGAVKQTDIIGRVIGVARP